jgi:6-phosphogluconolactonase
MKTISPDEAVLEIKNAISQVLLNKDTVVFAIPGGRSAKPVFEALKIADISWDKIHIFYVDERKVPKDHTDSNYLQTKTDFLNTLIAEKEFNQKNIHFCESVEQYNAELTTLGGKFDVALYGTGEDGHYCSIFPNRLDLLDATEDLFMDVENSPKPPSNRISASPNLIARTTYPFIFFMNEGKQGVYNKFRDESVFLVQCPCKQLLLLDNLAIVTNLT